MFSFSFIIRDNLYNKTMLPLPLLLSPIHYQTTHLQIYLTRLSKLSIYCKMPNVDNRAIQICCRFPLVCQTHTWQITRTHQRISMTRHLEMKTVVFLKSLCEVDIGAFPVKTICRLLHHPAAYFHQGQGLLAFLVVIACNSQCM